MQVSKEEIKHIAKLSMLKISDEEIEKYTNQMQDIISFAETVNSAATDGLEESLGGIESSNVFRKDEIKESMEIEEVLQNAPEQDEGMFKVPPVV